MKLPPQNLVKLATRWGDVNLSALRNWLSGIFVDFQKPKLSKRVHPLLGVFCALILVWLCLDVLMFPYMRGLEGTLSLRPTQWSQLENLVKLSKTNPTQQNTIEPLDDVELQKIRIILAAKKIKPSVLRLILGNPPRIEFQASDVLFSSIIDVLEELRTTWHLYPERVDVSSAQSMSIVNISATLSQAISPNAVLNFSGIEGATAR